VLLALLPLSGLHSTEPAAPMELAGKPPWQRLLAGAAAA
jgi:hypothetical protein